VTSFRVSVGPRMMWVRVLVVLLLAAAATGALLAHPQAALAHDTLLSTDPEDGSTVDSSPEKITLEYSANILDVSPVVRITDADGTVVQEGDPEIDGPDAIAKVEKPLDPGTYTIQWRVVSSDGHPIEGDFSFTVAGDGADAGPSSEASDAGGATSDGAASDAGGASDAGSAGGSSAPAAQQSTDQGENSLMVPLLIVLGVIVVAAVVVVLVIGRRGRDRDRG
jgi:methionine-rich copper-binding protein CopC